MKPRGGSLRKPAKRTVDATAFDEIGVQLNEAVALGDGQDGTTRVRIPADAIKKIDNPRETPCGLEEFQAVNWPSLETGLEELEQYLEDALQGHAWYEALSTVEKRDTLDFLSGIHMLACSIKDNTQLQPIILERDDPLSESAYLVSGERRTLAALYSRGAIPFLVADVYNERLPALKRAIFQDQENTQIKLKPHETLMSKRNIYKALPDATELPLSKLARVLGYATLSVPSILKRIFDHPREQDLIAVIRRDRMGWRDIERFVQKVKADPKHLERALNRTGLSTVESGSTAGDGQPDKTVLRQAASFGLAYKPKADYSLVRTLLTAALDSKSVSRDLKAVIKRGDTESVEGLLKVWAQLGEAIVELNGGADG